MSVVENRGRAASWLLLSAAVVLADQLTKSYITQHFGEFEFTRVLPVLDITRMHNVGAAFSFLASASGWQRWFFIALAVVVSIAITAWLCRLPRGTHGLLAAGSGIGTGRRSRQRDRSYSTRACDRLHTLSLGSRVFSRLQRGGFGDHRRCGASIAGCAA